MPKKKKQPREVPANEAAKGITKITVAGFKSIRDERTIEIRPLTILAGANSSGKSSMMQPLLLMKQTLEAAYDPGPFLLDGPFLEYTSIDEFLSRSPKGVPCSKLEVGITALGKATLSTTFQRSPDGKNLTIPEATFAFSGRAPFVLRPGMSNDEILLILPEVIKTPLLEVIPQSSRLVMQVVPRRCFLSLDLGLMDEPSERVFTMRFDLTPEEGFEIAIRSMWYLSRVREKPQRVYSKAMLGIRLRPTGTFSSYVPAVLAKWQAERDRKLSLVGTSLEHLGLTWKVEAQFPDDAHIALHVPRRKKGAKGSGADLVNIADVGLGVWQSLPVVVALVAAEPGQMVYIEEPELHLHPRAQVAMAEVLADAAKRGVRVVAETHSSLLLLGIQTLVAEGKLSPDLVKLHWFTRDDEGVTHIDSTNLDSAGRFKTAEWPQDFGDVELDLQGRYLDAG